MIRWSIAATLFLLSASAFSQTINLHSDTWAATDELGRVLPGFKECGPIKPRKFVGMFYFLDAWNRPQTVYDNTALLNADPNHPAYGPERADHYWGKPWLGYYRSDDPFVIRKHAEMLTTAGVDTVIFDVTNGYTFDSVWRTILSVYAEMRSEGDPTPQIVFFTMKKGAETAQHIYDLLYSKGLYKDLWFYWKGKPLLIAPRKGLSKEVESFFTIRESGSHTYEWMTDGHDQWRWIDQVPQHIAWDSDPKRPEEVSVSPASHPILNIGRSYHNGKEPAADKAQPALGINFDDQWRSALSIDPEFVFVTGWNEWTAMKFISDGTRPFLGRVLEKGAPFFIDEFNEEFSRDIEPMEGGFGDDYYYQLVSFIRRFKGVEAPPLVSASQTIDLDQGFDQWADVAPEYLDETGDTAHRLFPGVSNLTYSNTSGRNDFVSMKVARDDKNIYFYARTASPITAPAGPTWMTILIDADRDHKTGWEGYDFAINRTVGWLEKNIGGWKWEKVCPVKYVVSGNEIQVALPRSALLMFGKLNFEFKWVDDVPEWGNIMDFIDKGDVAPDGRFNYVFDER